MSKNEDRRNKPLDEAARKLSRNYEIEQRSKKTTQTQTQNTHTTLKNIFVINVLVDNHSK